MRDPISRIGRLLSPIRVSLSLLNIGQKRQYWFLTFGRSFLALLDLAGIFAVGLIIQIASGTYTENRYWTLPLDNAGSSSSLVFLVWVVASFFLLKSTLSAILLKSLTRFLSSTESRKAREVSAYIYGDNLNRLREYDLGSSQWASGTSTQHAFASLLLACSVLVSESSLFLVVLVSFMVLDWQLTLGIASFFFLLVLVFQIVVGRRLRELGESIRESGVRALNEVKILHSSFPELAVFEQRATFIDRYRNARLVESSNRLRQRFFQALPRFYVEGALFLGVGVLLTLQLTFGDPSALFATTGIVMVASMRLMAALLPIQGAIIEIRSTGPQANAAQTVLTAAKDFERSPLPTDPIGSADSDEQSENALAVLVKDINLVADSRQLLSEVSFSLTPGEKVLLHGPSGSGKSSLLDLLAGLKEPTSGEIWVHGRFPQNLRALRPGAIAIVTQKPTIFRGSLVENITFQQERQLVDETLFRESLHLAELDNFVQHRMQGDYQQILDTDRNPISGGELQRLGLARALYAKPKLLLLDEPTSGLDKMTERAIIDTVLKLPGEITIVVVSHNSEVANRFNKKLELSQGKIVETS